MALTKVTPQTNAAPAVERPISDYPDYGTRVFKASNVSGTGAFTILEENLVRKNYLIYNDTNQDFFIRFGDQPLATIDDWSVKIPAGLFYEPQTYVTPAKITGVGLGTGQIRITEMS